MYSATVGILYKSLRLVRKQLIKIRISLLSFNGRSTVNDDTNMSLGPILIASLALLTNLCFYMITILILIARSNDIELNPGPEAPEYLSLMHLNVCSLRNKIPFLESEIPEKCSILCLTETRIDHNFADDDILIPGYSKPLYRKDNTRNSGGICVQLAGNVRAVRLTEYEHNNLELLWLRISTGGQSFILGVGYRNPELPVEYWERLDENLSRIVDTYGSQNLILVGDFNEDLLNKRVHHFSDIINSYNLSQLINEPTRVTHHSRTLLDPIIVGNVSYVKSSGVLPPICSDHSPVFVDFKCKLPKYYSFKRRIYDYNRADWARMENEIDNIKWNEIFDSNNVDDSAEILTMNLTRTINSFIPSKIIKFSNRDKSWVTPKIKHEIRKRNRLYRKAKRSRSCVNWADFKHQRNYVTSLIRAVKKTHVQSMIDKMEQHNQSEKVWWKLVKCVTNTGHKESSIPCLMLNENVSVNKPIDKANILNDYFANICTVDDKHIPLFPNSYQAGNKLSTFETSPEEVYDELKKLDSSKAVGPDLISPIVLKQLAASLCEPLSLLYNKEVREHKHAFIWKLNNIAPIFKKDNPHLASNYRPISLLSIMGKIMEKLVFKRVFDHVSPHITTNQSGFLPHHSTITQLLEIYHILLEALDKRKEIVICFLDISKAFDRVSHRALINKLRKFNIDGDLLEWFINYLSNRKQRVTIDGVSSDWKDVLAGVPQGSILGPLLFLIFINDVTENINSIIRLFADDTSLLLPSIDLSTDLDVLQRDLDKIHQWAQKWAVNFNSDKTKTLLISRRSSPTVVNLTFDNTALQLSTEHKHLGVIFNEFATWNNHLEETINKANKRLGILRNLKYSLKRNTLKVLYTTYIRSVLEYADTVWDNIPQNLSNRIEQINKNAIRCITGLTISTTSKNLYKESGLLPLNKRRKFHRLVQMFKIINGLSPNYLQQLLPQTRLDRNPYVVRGGNLFTNVLCRTETFRNSYLPSAVRDWNLLPDDPKKLCCIV